MFAVRMLFNASDLTTRNARSLQGRNLSDNWGGGGVFISYRPEARVIRQNINPK